MRPVTSRWEAAPADSTGRLTPSRTTSAPSTRTSRLMSPRRSSGSGSPKHHDATDVPATRAGQEVGVTTARIGAQRGGDDVGGCQGARCGMAAELVGDQREVDQPVATDRSATVLLADQQGRPSQFGAAPPVRCLESGGVVAEPPDLGHRCLVGEELGGGVAEELLVGRQVQQQRMLPTIRARRRRLS